MIKDELLDYFNNAIEKNFFSHAYLIEVDSSYNTSIIIEIVKEIIKKDVNEVIFENISTLIDKGIYGDLKIIKPDGNNIKKEQILSLMNEYKNKSLTNTNRYYIIEYAEDLNVSAANTLLKFLEEPESNIISFLVTKNVNSVLETIKSRCQIINVDKNIVQNYSDDDLEQALKYLFIYENNKNKPIVYLNDLYSFKSDELKKIFEIWISIYADVLNKNINRYLKINKDFENLIKDINIIDIVKKINLLTDAVDLLKYNVNTRLLLDKIIIGGD